MLKKKFWIFDLFLLNNLIVFLMILYVFLNKFKSDEKFRGKVWNRNKWMYKR